MRTRWIVLAAAAAFVLSSCASLQRAQDEGSVQRVSRLINEGRATELAGLSSVPFLLDQEVVVLAKDVNAFWESAVAAGFRVVEPALEQGERVGPDSYKSFYDSFEVRTYFNKYLKKGVRLLTLSTGDGRRLALLVKDGLGRRTIYGFKGPY